MKAVLTFKRSLDMTDLTKNPQQDLPAVVLPKAKVIFYMIILYLLFASDYWARVGINSILPLIQADLKLTDTQVGTLGSVVLVGMMVFVMPIAYLADKWSRRGMICIMGGTWSIGTILCGVFPSLGALMVGRFMVGVGNSSYAPASVSTFTNWFPRSRWGTIISIYNTAIIVGISGGMLATGFLAKHFDWQMIFYIIGFSSLALSLGAIFLPKEAKKEDVATNKVTVGETLKTLFSTKSLLCASIASGCFNFSINAALTFGAIYFVREMDMEIAEAASFMGLATLGGVISGPIGGALLDKFYKKTIRARGLVPAVYLTIAGICYMYGFMFENIPTIIAGFFIATMAPAAYHVVTQEIVPAKYRASSYGALVIFLQLGGSLGSIMAGVLSQNYDVKISLTICSLGLVASAVFFLGVALFYPSDFKRLKEIEA